MLIKLFMEVTNISTKCKGLHLTESVRSDTKCLGTPNQSSPSEEIGTAKGSVAMYPYSSDYTRSISDVTGLY